MSTSDVNSVSEEWKPIWFFDGVYEVSNLGRVRSKERVVHRAKVGPYLKKSKLKASYTGKEGYPRVILYYNGKIKTMKIHRLVAILFVDNPNKKTVVNHLDGDRSNCRSSNLEWVSTVENIAHGQKRRDPNKKTGTRFSTQHNRWISSIYLNGKYTYLGSYKDQESAHLARVKYESENGIENKYI